MKAYLTPKMARWAAAAALALALVAGGVFAYRLSVARRAMRHGPPVVPPSVRQRSLKFTFSKVDGEQTVFTIHAARATRYADRTGSLLEDVDIVVNGEHGERHDEIHTRSCEYESQTGAIVCHGKVELDLSSVPLAKPVSLAPSGGIQVATQNVTFNRDTGTATSDAPVTFRFPQGEGSGDGADYSSRGADFRLRRDVQIRLTGGRAAGAPTLVTAKGGLTFDRRSNQLRLQGPVEIRQGERRIDAGQLTVDLTSRLRPRRAFTGGKTRVSAAQGNRRGDLHVRSLEILFDQQGRAERVSAVGGVVFTGAGPAATEIQAQKAAIALDPASRQPRTVDLSGEVRLQEKRPTGVVRLGGDSLRLVVAPVKAGAKALRMVKATMPGKARGEWHSESGDLRLASGRLAILFSTDNQIQALRGSGGVRLERLQPGQTPLVTTADNLDLDFAGGRWARARESGHVHATEGARSANADHAVWLRAPDAFELTGHARINDPGGELLADTVAWNQKSGALKASGHVRLIYTATNGVAGGAASRQMDAVNIVAATLEGNSKTGYAAFSNSARLWTGNLVLQADRIEFHRAPGELIATGNVRGAFPQASFKGAFTGKGRGASRAAQTGGESANGGKDRAMLWRVKAERLSYVPKGRGKPGAGRGAMPAAGLSGEVTLDGGAQAWSTRDRIEAQTLVLSLRRQPGGQVGLTQARGSGGVKIRQADRWGQAENARYDAATGRFVLWGGKPFLRDQAGDLVRGTRLTFSQTDDTILVESSDGSRTVTRHPVRN